MKPEIHSFPPYRVELYRHTEQESTTIRLTHSNCADLPFRAPAASVSADPTRRMLFFHTAYSDYEDSSALFCIDLESGKIIWRVSEVPPGGSIRVDPSAQTVEAGNPYGTGETFIVRVDYGGKVLIRNPRSGYEMVDLGIAALKAGKENEAMQLLRKSLATSISDNTKAKVLKHLGEATEKTGDKALAIRLYRNALELNPKVGVKRNLAKLEKEDSV